MKIVVISQPFPMGEYHWKNYEAKYLSSLGHDVYMLEQLNGVDYDEDYINQIKELDADLIYSTPADHKTFEVIEQIKCRKIINICSLGIMKNHIKEWVDYHGKWWDEMFTNSIVLHNHAKKVTKSIHYEFPLVPIKENEIEFVEEYNHECVFLGQGFHRLQIPEFQNERDVFFFNRHEFNFQVYGNGWPQTIWSRGVLPDGHIGKLYSSAKSAVGVIEKDQRIYGLINNRYSEMAYCKVPIITLDYKDIDWFGAEKHLNFVSSYSEFRDTVYKCVEGDETIVNKSVELKKFIDNQHNVYLEKLRSIIGD